MRKGIKTLAASLAVAMLFTSMPVYAAPKSKNSWSSWSSWWNKGSGSSSSSSSNSSASLMLLEDESTVQEGTELRAATYAETKAGATLKYFPVTLYNYDASTINNATHQVEVDGGLGDTWNGIYFNNGNPTAESYTYSTTGGYTYSSTTVDYSKNNNYSTYTNGSYYVKVGNNYYVVTNITCTYKWSVYHYVYSWTITYDGGSTTSSNSSITLYTRKASNTATTNSLPYANWNYWTGFLTTNNTLSSKQTDQKGYVYSGLVAPKMENGQLKFTVPDGGIFDSTDTTTKSVYTNVGLPFVYNEKTGYYTFDASQDGAYFNGTPSSNTNLNWSDTPQYNSNQTGFYPFNNGTTVGSPDYHFGMIATIPFSMTSDGMTSSTSGEPIVFDFAGDDDVWVFIDGTLVLDIGGIHNSVNGSINFAQNTTTVSSTDSSLNSGAIIKGGTSSAGAISGKLFSDEKGTGVLNTDLASFAAADQHTLTVYYLERGEGSSNCKISFNLPMKDTVAVRKTVADKDSAGVALNDEVLAQINNRDFGFTLYKDAEAVAKATYNLYNVDNQYIATASTDERGHFNLKNGQTAKFTGEIAEDGTTYYVMEDGLGDNWEAPSFTYTSTAANGVTETPSSVQGTSMSVTANGSAEAEDAVTFVCTNTMKHIDSTSIEANDDKVVIDYGLPVEIDVLANDVAVGGTKSIVEEVISGQYGTATVENGKIKYQLTKQLSGVEKLEYTVKVTAAEEVDNKTAKASVYIIPATSMYYEEDFTGLVSFTQGGWTTVGSAQTDPQESGVVGTTTDSPYGSDVAYLNDSGDSNGSSQYVNTASDSAKFSYEFTGTGTSFFARTTNNSGYMRVVIKQNGNVVNTFMRDTSYKTNDSDITLYNVPVFTYEADNYGTYTVEVTIAGGANSEKYGKEFWLDGIRVIEPLNTGDAYASTAREAYATDGEANMTVATLRQKLLKDYTVDTEDGTVDWIGEGFVIFTDTNGEIKKASEYESNGPKEEVYLNKDQSVTFALKNWDRNSHKVYLGIKAPMGEGTVDINGHSLDIRNAADCYYEISDYVRITTDGDGVFEVKCTSDKIISITNIKVTGDAEFTIVGQEDISANVYAVMERSRNLPDDAEEPEDEEETLTEPDSTEETDLSDDDVTEAEEVADDVTESEDLVEEPQTETSGQEIGEANTEQVPEENGLGEDE